MSNLSFKTKMTLDIIRFYTSICNKNKLGKSIQTDFHSSNIEIVLRRVRVLCKGWGSRIRRRQGERLPDVFYNAGVLVLVDDGKK